MSSRLGPFQSTNYRLFYGGQSLSLIGTWMQQVASAWLVLTLTHSGTMLGIVVAAQMLPVLLLGPYGGLIADRLDKRRLLIASQIVLGLISLTTAILISTDSIRLWMVIVLAVMLGIVNAAANPARQSFVSELVDKANLRTAVSLNSVLVNTARAIGPAVAGVLIATTGIETCFYIDAASYIIVIVAYMSMRKSKLHTPEPAVRAKGQTREGFRYVRSEPTLYVPLLMMVIIGTFAYEFQVLLPLLAKETFAGDASTLGTLTSAQGIGAIVGGLYVARRGSVGIASVTKGAALFCLAMAVATVVPNFKTEVVALFFVGAASVQFLSVGNSTLQLKADPRFRGRVMALWSMAFLGSTPVGGPAIGWLAEHFSPRLGMGVGAASCFVAVLLGVSAVMKERERRQGVAAKELQLSV